MKNKIAIASAFLAAASFSTAEIVINDFLSFEGFVDMSYSHTDGEFDNDRAAPNEDESNNSYGIDQVEISWLFNFDTVTAQIDLQYEESNSDGVEVEQAFVNLALANGDVVTAGRYASMLGFEAYEPTGLYQFSTAYAFPIIGTDALRDQLGDAGAAIVGSTITPVSARYAQGVKYTIENDKSFFGISLQDGTTRYSGRLGGDTRDDFDADDDAEDDGGFGVEIAFAYDFDNGITYFIGASYEEGDGYGFENDDDSQTDTGDTEAYVINSYVTYETGAWLFAAEVNYGENDIDDVVENANGGPGADAAYDAKSDTFSALLMANYAYSDVASVTGRVSYVDYGLDTSNQASDADLDMIKLTAAHNYAFTDNLLLVTEISYTDGKIDSDQVNVDGDFNELLGAVELIFSF